ncbi:uncharacterized protein [Miscanthus floridulus]|uniref:uncharacterized protein n=1 Tax=Miscanthus floridulus TaxID=154761 RepID=UPI003457DB55
MGAAAARRGGVRAAEAPLHEELSASSSGVMRRRWCVRSWPRAAAAPVREELSASSGGAMRCSGARCGPSQSSRRSTDGARPGLQSLASPSRPETERRLRDSATTAGSVEEYSDHGSLQWIQIHPTSSNVQLELSGGVVFTSVGAMQEYCQQFRMKLPKFVLFSLRPATCDLRGQAADCCSARACSDKNTGGQVASLPNSYCGMREFNGLMLWQVS